MKIALGSDHRGFALKEFLKTHAPIDNQKIEWLDFGACNNERSDYPLFVEPVCRALQQGDAHKGILICSTGVGMSIAANRFKHIYAALVWNEKIAAAARQEDNANVLVLPSDFVTQEQIVAIVRAWLTAEFRKGRYQERLDMVDAFGGV